MEHKREWHRATSDSVNTSVRVPNELHDMIVRYQNRTGLTKSEVIIAALWKYLQEREEGGGRD